MAKILVVEDSETQRFLIAKLLSLRLGHTCVEATNGAEALAFIKGDKDGSLAAVVLDLEMPEMDGREALPKIRALRPDLPVIVLTATQSVEDVVAVMKLGAADFLIKPPDVVLLRNALEKVLAVQELRGEVARLSRTAEGRTLFTDIIGHDGDLALPIKLARRAAASDITVMMTGESGVGKEVFARAIHGESARKGKPFVAVNCGALPRDLVESILFGHKKGAFTGAVADALGKFREAEGGTLFLDEVGELPLDAQVKLLRALQQREVEPVGGGKPVPVTIRVIAATNRDPAQEVKRGRFREDLFYRLNVFPIHLPPLRQRPHDVVPLAIFFARHYAVLENRVLHGISAAAKKWIQQHQWPGNVRELENKIYRAVLLAEGEVIETGHLENAAGGDEIPHEEVSQKSEAPLVAVCDSDGTVKSMERIEHEAMRAALQLKQGNVVAAAQALHISKSTFYKKMKGKVGG